ncbi:MAG: arginine--tRNA ligase [Candidatus Liptonbacteria bacterium]|nr:arginine--tRNA ligase [Candidatus Liptonbacteria bacterium]
MQDKIKAILERVLERPIPSSVSIEVSDDESHGHYATNAAFSIARETKSNTGAVARDLAEKIYKAAEKGFFEKVESTPNGFINFWLSPAALQKELGEMLSKGDSYGSSDFLRGEKIQLEFISANPTGPLTLANGRGGFFGDALANVLMHCGAKVEREYYVNDTGNQILTLGKSILAAAARLRGDSTRSGEAKEIPDEEKFYKGEYIKEWAVAHPAEVGSAADPLALGKCVAADLLKEIRRAIEEKARIHFDRWTSEDKDIHEKGFVEKALAIFKDRGMVYDAEGAVWLKTTEFGDDKDRVLITSDKYPTYFLADAGHFLETKKRGFSDKILVLGPDHYGYVKRISVAAELVGIEAFEAIVTQAIRLVENGVEVKMSKRKGKFVMFEELIDEVGADAARFFFLQVAPESHMDFDMGLAKERSAKNPVYYAQYAYVRANKIIEKVKSDPSVGSGQVRQIGREALARLTGENELRLIRALVQFPAMVAQAAATRRVHHLAQYAVAIAKSFHGFYEKERVAGVEKEIEEARVLLVRGVAAVLGNVFTMLGISKPEKM